VAPLTEKFRGHDRKSTPPFIWTDKDHEHFEKAKELLSSPSMLTLFDPSRPVHLYTDWSTTGIGSYIAQPDDNGFEQPIAYASRKCKESESKYHPYMGEILALVEALNQHYQSS
jgi:hypothetical protein